MERKGFLRNFIFGGEDSLVSTVGLLSGVSFAGFSIKAVIVSGIILILVEALSMGAGVYISEDSTNELTPRRPENAFKDALTMFGAYILAGLIPLAPYFFAESTVKGFYLSVLCALVGLFCLGLFKGFYVGKSPVKSALKIFFIGAVVVLISVLVGRLVKVG